MEELSIVASSTVGARILYAASMLANRRLRAERKEPRSGVNAVSNTRTSQDFVPNCLSVDILAPASFVPSSRPVEFKSWT